MDRTIEELRKIAEPVHEHCLGRGFTPEAEAMLSAPRCAKIDPLPVFEIIDEETGAIDTESAPEFTTDDEACRCSVYFRPASWWRRGRCPMATHYNPEELVNKKVRVGQQKQKKKEG